MMKDVEMVDEIWEADGIVWGNFWGGGQGGYKSRSLLGHTRSEIINKAKKGLEDGSLDSGMGYESVIGAMLCIKKTTKISVDGEQFYRVDTEIETIGELDDEAKAVMSENLGCW